MTPSWVDPEEDALLLRDRQRITTRLNTALGRFADRSDLMMSCLWRLPQHGEGLVWYSPEDKRVVVNATVALQGGLPESVNPLTWRGRRKNPGLVGLVVHGAAHSRCAAEGASIAEQRHALLATEPATSAAMGVLHEARVEWQQVQQRPADRHYLRAQSILVDLSAFQAPPHGLPASDERWHAAATVTTAFGRADAGILTPYDLDHLLSPSRSTFGAEATRLAREAQLEAMRLPDTDITQLVECARRLVASLELAPTPPPLLAARTSTCANPDEGLIPLDHSQQEDRPDTEWAYEAEPTSPHSVEAPEEDPRKEAVVLSDIGAALQHMAAEIHVELEDEETVLSEADEASQAASVRSKQRAQEVKQHNRERQVAATVFDPDTQRAPMRRECRAPTNQERRLVRQVAKALREARFRDRSSVKFASQLPPGRLDGRDAMLGAAQRSMGSIVTARPFHGVRHRRSPEPPVTLGVLADFSASMGWASGAMASVSWMLAHALSSVGGTYASALFAESVVPLVRPGELPHRVQQYAATGGWEDFGRAWAAINGALNLTSGKGARVLVVLSDGFFTKPRAQRAQQDALSQLNRCGARVLWVGHEVLTMFPDGATQVPLRARGRRGAEDLVGAITEALADALRSLR